jgi:hypothetical protein
LAVPQVSVARQLSAASEIEGAFYPRDPVDRPAITGEVRGWSSIDYDRSLLKNLNFNGDVVLYWSSDRDAFVDGEARLVWRGSRAELAAGLLRERWGRFTDSPFDPLGHANTPFSLVHPEQRLSELGVRGTFLMRGISLDVYGLAGGRRQPLPDGDGRLGFGVATRDVAERGAMGNQAIAIRVSGTELDLDWGVHVFGGLNRRPTFVPRFKSNAQLAGIDATYTQILQFGGEIETTRASWRFLAEGFGRLGAIDVTGNERAYGYIDAAAEYQRLGAFDGAYNVIPRFEVMVDTRGDRADIPFASGTRAAMRVAQTRRLPTQVDIAYGYDWAFRGHSVMTSIEKALAESPTFNVGFRLTAFSAGNKRSILDVWRDDLELASYVRIEFSR